MNENYENLSNETIDRIMDILNDDNLEADEAIILMCINTIRFIYRSNWAKENSYTNIFGWFGDIMNKLTQEAQEDILKQMKNEE